MWDFGSGQEIKTKPGRTSDEDLSIIGLMYTTLEGDRVILATGWNNKIRMILVRVRVGVRSRSLSYEDLSIIGLMYTTLEGDRVILATGWNNKSRMILVSVRSRSVSGQVQ